jgi:hypothetical protein
MNLNIKAGEVHPNVNPVRKVGADKTTYRGIRLNLTDGGHVTFWVPKDVSLALAIQAMADQERLLRAEGEQDGS